MNKRRKMVFYILSSLVFALNKKSISRQKSEEQTQRIKCDSLFAASGGKSFSGVRIPLQSRVSPSVTSQYSQCQPGTGSGSSSSSGPVRCLGVFQVKGVCLFLF